MNHLQAGRNAAPKKSPLFIQSRGPFAESRKPDSKILIYVNKEY